MSPRVRHYSPLRGAITVEAIGTLLLLVGLSAVSHLKIIRLGRQKLQALQEERRPYTGVVLWKDG